MEQVALMHYNNIEKNWDSNRFAQAVKNGASKSTHPSQLEILYEKVRLGMIDKPSTIVDKHEQILQ